MLLSKLNNQRIIFFFIIYLLFIIISSIIYGYLINIKNNIYDENYNIIFLNIPFSNGELIYNLFYNKKYFTNFNDINFYLQKTPAIPFLILIISLISKNFYFIIIIKNILVFSFYFFCCFKISHYENKNYLFFFILLFIPIIILYNFSVAINFFYEDSLIAILLPLLFLTLITNYKYKYLLISIILFVLYFVKTSMFFIISFVPILIIFLEKKKIIKFLPFLFSLLAILIWGFYGLNKTGRFPILKTSSSINSHVLASVMNENFHRYYPDKSTDLIPIYHKLPNNIKSEWSFYDFYEKKNQEYFEKNLSRYFKDLFIKLKFIFFGINRDGALPDQNGNFDNSIRISLIFSKFLFNLSIILSILVLLKNFKTFFLQKKEIYFFSLVILNLSPHLIAWATSKHLVAISNISMIYLLFYFTDKNKLNL